MIFNNRPEAAVQRLARNILKMLLRANLPGRPVVAWSAAAFLPSPDSPHPFMKLFWSGCSQPSLAHQLFLHKIIFDIIVAGEMH